MYVVCFSSFSLVIRNYPACHGACTVHAAESQIGTCDVRSSVRAHLSLGTQTADVN